ncbi:unnamed protein product [Cylindrotheca closterium]|uniref:Reverse transcriptase domain-containing protein n=1 Tax=Cylindrotheca closterium TaxID=2856 RepID=A0AAD2CZV1_9STRA|nr:unnamed protein product [Cylindrotheca closterium]
MERSFIYCPQGKWTMLQKRVYPLPKISDLLTDISGFTYASAIDLNMGCWNVRITPETSKLCTIILPWGKYIYQKLPMGAMSSAYIFQEAMNRLMEGLSHILTYLDDILCVTKGDFEDHLQRLELCLQRLHKAGLKVNLPKSEFATQQFKCLGYLVLRQGIRPLASKVEAIQQLKPPKTLKQLCSFLGMLNYYRDMWEKRSHMLAPFTELIK